MGPLAGVKVVELAGIGPGPFCCMLLADMGADVIRVDRTAPVDLGVPRDPRFALLHRGRRSIGLDLKRPEAVSIVRRMVENADLLVEGFRPGVTERMGLGPDDCLALNPRLVYGRMTGWGQEGPLAQAAGHDINYIALTGALGAIGPAGEAPVPPLNLLGDFGGGAVYLAFGLVSALLEARSSGRGQVVDAAIVDGVAHLMTDVFGKRAGGLWNQRGTNLLDGGAPFYGVYRTKDDLYISVAPIEKKFFRELVAKTGLAADRPHFDEQSWPDLRRNLTELFLTRTRAEWVELLEGTDVCFAPVLALDEAEHHPHVRERQMFVEIDGIAQPAPAPRFSRTKGEVKSPPAWPGQHSDEVLAEYGFSPGEIRSLRDQGVVA